MIAEEVGISEATVLNILHEDLRMNKVSARCILKLLNPEQTLCRQHICEENLRILADDEDLFSKIITDEETWIYHGDPPTKQESVQEFSTAKKAKNGEFVRKANGDGVLGHGRNLTD
jgi:predicted transcriptional regulator